MLMINNEPWYKPLVNGYVNALEDFAGDATENECVLGAINWTWYHYPTREEALEGLRKRSPEDYKQELKKHWTTGCIKEFSTKEEALEFFRMAKDSEDYKDVRLRYFSSEFYKKSFPDRDIEGNYTAFFSYASTGWCICHMEAERYGIEHWAYRLHK